MSKLAAYSFDLKHIAGRKNTVADALKQSVTGFSQRGMAVYSMRLKVLMKMEFKTLSVYK